KGECMKISEVPMLTADECEIKLNDVVYDFHFDQKYRTEAYEGNIRAYRVISVNESSRHYRLRCEKGCESEHSFKSGCERNKYYSQIGNAKSALKARALKEAQSTQSEIDKK